MRKSLLSFTVVPEWVAVLLSILAMLGTLYSGYAHADKESSIRLTTVETQQKDQDDKINHIQSQVDKLVEWAMGSTK